jgi:hypothetical protein
VRKEKWKTSLLEEGVTESREVSGNGVRAEEQRKEI